MLAIFLFGSAFTFFVVCTTVLSAALWRYHFHNQGNDIAAEIIGVVVIIILGGFLVTATAKIILLTRALM